jgi:hypothetical protein
MVPWFANSVLAEDTIELRKGIQNFELQPNCSHVCSRDLVSQESLREKNRAFIQLFV